MAIKFALRGDSLNARYSLSGKTPLLIHKSDDTAPAATASGIGSVFGGFIIPLHSGTATQNKQLVYPGYKNFSANNAWTVLIRIVPGFTSGAIPRSQALFQAGIAPNGDNSSYCDIQINTDSTLNFDLRDRATACDINGTTSSAFAFTDGVATDILVSWDSTASPKLTFAQDGVVISTHNPAGTSFPTNWALWPMISIGKRPGDNATADQCVFSVNEVLVYDTVVTSAVRSAWATVSALDGLANTSAGAGNIRSGSTEVIEGATITGTAVIPTAANVRSGTAVDATTGTLAVPAASNVRSGTAVDNTTGTAAIPIAANVRSGTATDATTGSLIVPSAANVRSGTSVDATTGTLAVPIAANVRSGTAVDNTTGTAAIPIAANVRSGTATDATTGSLIVPATTDVRLGTSVDAGTGALIVPATNQVKIGVTFDAASVGTYVASERYTSIPEAKVEENYAYKDNSTTNNKTGTLAVNPASSYGNLTMDIDSDQFTANEEITSGDGPLTLDMTFKNSGTAISIFGSTITASFLKTDGSTLSKSVTVLDDNATPALLGKASVVLTALDIASLRYGRNMPVNAVKTVGSQALTYFGRIAAVRAGTLTD